MKVYYYMYANDFSTCYHSYSIGCYSFFKNKITQLYWYIFNFHFKKHGHDFGQKRFSHFNVYNV